jgi:Skp family chaperone for outer membrane proteins
MKAVWIVATLALVSIAYSLNGAAQAARGPTKVAFVSSGRLIAAAPELQAVLAKFQAAQRQRLADLQPKQRALQETRRKLAQAPDPIARAALTQQEQTQQAELERLTAQTQTEMQASQRETQALVQSHLKTVLDQVAIGQGIDLVLNADLAVLWGSTQLDITNAVIERLNAKPSPPATPKP